MHKHFRRDVTGQFAGIRPMPHNAAVKLDKLSCPVLAAEHSSTE